MPDKDNDSNEKIIFTYTAMQTLENAPYNKQYQESLQKVQKELSALNMNRGGKNTDGFVFERMHTAEKNSQFLWEKQGDRLGLIDDNGVADLALYDSKGHVSYQQAKMGYTGSNKYKITKPKYDGQTIIVDKGNAEAIAHIKKTNEIKGSHFGIEESPVSRKSVEKVTNAMKSEANMRQTFGLSNTQPITASLYAASQQLKNAAIAGTNAVKTSGALTAGVIFGKNMYELIEGNTDLKDFLLDTAKQTIRTGLESFAAGSAGYFVSGLLANPTAAAMNIIISTKVGATIVSLGSLAVTMSAAAGPMFLLGMAIGTGYAVCKAIKGKINKYQHRISEINRVLEIALSSMRDAYNSLDETIKRTFDFWDQQFEQGFTNMMEALMTNDFVSFSSGLNTVMNVFGSNVLFQSMDEFDNFFFDDCAVLTL